METVFEGAIIINKGGTYDGRNFKGDGVNAILVSTSEPVIIKNAVIQAKGSDAIKMYGYSSVELYGCKIIVDYDDAGNQKGRTVNNYKPRKFIMENCEWEETSGVLLDHSDEFQPSEIRIKYNKAKNATKAKKDGSNGGSHCQFVQLSNIQGYNKVEVAFNEFVNEPGKSWVEDNISINECKGTELNPIIIHDNYIYGAFPLNLYEQFYTGSGITTEAASEYVEAYNNQVIGCMNASMNIAGGKQIHYKDNTMISASLLPDGTFSYLFWANCAIFNSNGTPKEDFSTNWIRGNTLGYVRKGKNTPYKDRQDFMDDLSVNTMKVGENISLHDAPITKETENAEKVIWNKKLIDNKVYVGITNTNLNMILSLKEGEVKTGTILAVDESGKETTYTLNTVDYTSGDVQVAKVVEDSKNEKAFTVTAIKKGTTQINVSLVGNRGNKLVKTLDVVVESKEAETKDIQIKLN